MSEPSFDDLTDVYEAMIDWPRRLANEGPLLRRLFERHGVSRVADVACGTGHHAHLFGSWGLQVEASDISPRMVGRARALFGESDRLRWHVRGFDQPAGPAGSFDAAVCFGNSLALAPGMEAAGLALRQMFHAVRAGGLVLVHVLNLWKLPDGPCVWQKLTRQTLPTGEAIILKGVHRAGCTGYVELAVIADPAAGLALRSESVPFLGLTAQGLEAAARDAGAAHVTFFGGYQEQPYDPAASTDLILVATRG